MVSRSIVSYLRDRNIARKKLDRSPFLINCDGVVRVVVVYLLVRSGTRRLWWRHRINVEKTFLSSNAAATKGRDDDPSDAFFIH